MEKLLLQEVNKSQDLHTREFIKLPVGVMEILMILME